MEYEKLLDFCDFCGMIGHLVTECGDGTHGAEDCEWGNWMMVKFDYPSHRPGYGRGGGRGSGRGGEMWNRGRGFGDDRNTAPRGAGRGNDGDLNPQESVSMDMERGDDLQGKDVVPFARKRLISQDGTVNIVANSSMAPPLGFVTDQVLLIEHIGGGQIDKTHMSTPQKLHDNKRLKANMSESTEELAVSSSGEGRRSQ